jgi:hypothetical protein
LSCFANHPKLYRKYIFTAEAQASPHRLCPGGRAQRSKFVIFLPPNFHLHILHCAKLMENYAFYFTLFLKKSS